MSRGSDFCKKVLGVTHRKMHLSYLPGTFFRSQLSLLLSELRRHRILQTKKNILYERHIFFSFCNETWPDTRLPQSRAGGQGPYLRSPEHLGRSGKAKKLKKAEKVKCDGPTDGPTKRGVESRARD